MWDTGGVVGKRMGELDNLVSNSHIRISSLMDDLVRLPPIARELLFLILELITCTTMLNPNKY